MYRFLKHYKTSQIVYFGHSKAFKPPTATLKQLLRLAQDRKAAEGQKSEMSAAAWRAGICGEETGDFSAEGAGFHSPRQRLGNKAPSHSSPERAAFFGNAICVESCPSDPGPLMPPLQGSPFFISPNPRTLPGASLLSPFRAVSQTKYVFLPKDGT